MQNRKHTPVFWYNELSDGSRFLYGFGISLQAQSQSWKAVTAFNEAIAHFNAKAYEKAIISYSKAIELDPAYTKGMLQQRQYTHQSPNYKGAIADYNKVINLDAKFAKAWLYKGYWDENQEKTKAAPQIFQYCTCQWSKFGCWGFSPNRGVIQQKKLDWATHNDDYKES